jgi:LPS-assembly lipoprotein
MIPKRALLLTFMAVTLSACGFTPLYGVQGVAPTLAAIEVTAPPGRAGFLLRGQLDDAFGRNVAVPPAYRLTMNLVENRYPRGVRVDNVANRYELVLGVDYTLTAVKGGVVRTGHVQSSVTYDSADQPYASIAAEQDGQERAAVEAARQIQLDLASWLAKRGAVAPKVPA